MHGKRIAIVLVLALAGLCSMPGCGRVREEEKEILVTIGDTQITVEDFNERVANLPERYRELAKRRKAAYVQELINDTLLYQEALRRELDRDEEVQKVIAEARKKILIAKLLSEEVDEALEISDEEINDFYREHRHLYMTPEVLRASHILLNSIDDALQVIREIKEGARFQDVARARSLDPTAQQGGDIGYFPRGQLLPEFDNACARLEVGEISDVVRTALGYHVIWLTDRKPSSERPVEDVRDEIYLRLREMKRRELFNSLLERLKDETEIEVNEDALSTDIPAGDDLRPEGDTQHKSNDGG